MANRSDRRCQNLRSLRALEAVDISRSRRAKSIGAGHTRATERPNVYMQSKSACCRTDHLANGTRPCISLQPNPRRASQRQAGRRNDSYKRQAAWLVGQRNWCRHQTAVQFLVPRISSAVCHPLSSFLACTRLSRGFSLRLRCALSWWDCAFSVAAPCGV